jgi:hypothetical protein
MANQTLRLQRWWARLRGADPYWDNFLHRPPSDPRNVITPVILSAPAGSVFPQKTEIHDPTAMSGHIKELAMFFGADATGIAAVSVDDLPGNESAPGSAESGEQAYSAAIACIVSGVDEFGKSEGIGGQFATQKCAVVNFNIAAYIRELGYRAAVTTQDAEQYAAAAGLGRFDAEGRFSAQTYGRRIGLAGAVLTDLPLTADTTGHGKSI